MKRIQENFKLKEKKIEPPDIYLGATLDNTKLESGKYCWTMLPEQYLKAVVTNVEEDLARSGKRLPLKCVTPLSSNYAPCMEDFLELMTDGVHLYQELIGQIIWYVDIGRQDILLETLMLLRYLAIPRVGYLEQSIHIFGYLKTHPNRKLGFGPAHPVINENRFHQCEWTDFCKYADEAIPGNTPVARGNLLLTHCFVDANHAVNTETRRSHTSILFLQHHANNMVQQ